MGGAGIDDPHLAAMGHFHRLARGIIVQAQHREIGGVEGFLAGGAAFALGIIQNDQRKFAPSGQPVGDFEAGGASGAIDEYRYAQTALSRSDWRT